MRLNDKAKETLQTVVDKFQAGDLSPLVQVATFRLAPTAPASQWTLSNRVLAYAQTGTLDCRGYKQWLGFGRNVKKGSRAAYILRPNTIKKEKDGQEEYRLVGFAPIPVFGAESTEGDTPLPDYTPAELPPLVNVAKRMGISINYTPTPPDRRGDYTPGQDKINLGTDDHKTFFHELAHALHQRIDGMTGDKTHVESVAEFTATVLMALYGLGDRSGNCWLYISRYSKDPLTAITKALSTVEKVLDLLFEEE